MPQGEHSQKQNALRGSEEPFVNNRPADERYETGDKLYHKQVDSTEWKGPGVVIGQDGVVIFVHHWGTYVRVHQSRLQKVEGSQGVLRERDNQLMGTENATLPETGLYENDTVNESEEEAPSNDEDAEDNNEPPHTSAHSNTTCEGLKLKSSYIHRQWKWPSTHWPNPQPGRKGHWNIQKLVQFTVHRA